MTPEQARAELNETLGDGEKRLMEILVAAARREGARRFQERAVRAAEDLGTGFAWEYRDDVAEAIAALPLDPQPEEAE